MRARRRFSINGLFVRLTELVSFVTGDGGADDDGDPGVTIAAVFPLLKFPLVLSVAAFKETNSIRKSRGQIRISAITFHVDVKSKSIFFSLFLNESITCCENLVL